MCKIAIENDLHIVDEWMSFFEQLSCVLKLSELS